MSHLAEYPPYQNSADWQLRVTDRSGSALHGAAALVTPHHLVTCAHVVRAAVGEAGPGSRVSVDAPRGAEGWTATAEVLPGGWWWRDGSPWDAAVLRLDRPAPARPAVLAGPPRVGDRVRVVGFAQSPSGRWVTGSVAGSGGSHPEYVQIDTDPGAGAVFTRGFSGGGVREEETDALVGIVCEAATEGRLGWMIPMTEIRPVWESDRAVPTPPSPPRLRPAAEPPTEGAVRRAVVATGLAMSDLDTLTSPDQRRSFHQGLDRRLRTRVRLDQDPRTFAASLVHLAHREFDLLAEVLDQLDAWEEGSASMRRVRDAAAPLLEWGSG
ncbi:trypsin-like peptidase domain-containing protein [Nocardiopsis sp. FIRDI 009]|uniref:trypsin-like peptidase domain-containing protein n=1 Tax=Nocardiopsis sp. FIRDI 009 TaxID=714197 RepID=UPI000E24DDE3|nr:trypsin-like peptidase domain-containing protein [Nocardiopsis sp. FIRDI 009]